MKTNHSKIRLLMLIIFTGILSLTALSKAQAANDDKVYPGWMCRGQSADSSRFLRYNHNGSIINTHPNNPVTVLCPIVRDVLNIVQPNADVLSVKKVTVNYTSNDSKHKVNCSVARFWEEGTQVRTASNKSPSGVKTSYFHINVGKGSANNHQIKTYYTMTCSLPPIKDVRTAKLHSYRVRETSSLY